MSIHLHGVAETLSTNDLARTLALSGAPHGTVVHANRQLAGRGRRGRSWWSPPVGAALMSIILRPRLPPERVAALSLAVGLTIANTLVAHGLDARIKWPNDILIGGLKVAGVLSELVEDDAGRPLLIVGIGINVDFDAADFPPDLHGIATTMRTAGARRFDVLSLTREIGEAVVDSFAAFEARGLDIPALIQRSDTVGARVRDESGRTGTALGIAGSGALQVLWDGAPAPTEFWAGDVVRVQNATST